MSRKSVRQEKRQATDNAVATHQPILMVTKLDFACSLPARAQGYLTAEHLPMELQWHLKYGPDGVPKVMKEWGKWPNKITLVRAAIERYLLRASQEIPEPAPEARGDAEDPEQLVTIEDLEGYDSEEDYYS